MQRVKFHPLHEEEADHPRYFPPLRAFKGRVRADVSPLSPSPLEGEGWGEGALCSRDVLRLSNQSN